SVSVVAEPASGIAELQIAIIGGAQYGRVRPSLCPGIRAGIRRQVFLLVRVSSRCGAAGRDMPVERLRWIVRTLESAVNDVVADRGRSEIASVILIGMGIRVGIIGTARIIGRIASTRTATGYSYHQRTPCNNQQP